VTTITRDAGARPARFTDGYLKKLQRRVIDEGLRELVQFEASGSGLGVRASASNVSFIFQLRLKGGRRWREAIGSWGKLTVAQAREAVQIKAGDIAKEVDPFEKRREAEVRAKAEAEEAEARKLTLRVLIDKWARDHLSGQRPSYGKRVVNRLLLHFEPLLDLPAKDIAKLDVKRAVEKTKESGPAAAFNAAAALRSAYRWALGEDLIDTNPLDGLKTPPKPKDRDRVLMIDETRRVWAAAGTLDYPIGHYFCLLMLTGCRRAEIGGLRWDEIADEIIDDETAGKAIELPGSRTKTGVGHHIPLSKAALEVIEDCKRHRVVGSPFVLTNDGVAAFANFSRAKLALDAALAGDGGPPIPAWRAHDLRRTLVSTLARKPFRFAPHVLDKLLGHQPSNLSPIALVYQQEEFHDLRREALEAWGHWLTQPGAEVVDLKRERELERKC
jgi:integrase